MISTFETVIAVDVGWDVVVLILFFKNDRLVPLRVLPSDDSSGFTNRTYWPLLTWIMGLDPCQLRKFINELCVLQVTAEYAQL